MQENILNLPHHLRRLRLVHSQRVALAMAGEYHLNDLQEIDRNIFPELWFAARAYHESMLDAVENKCLQGSTIWRNIGGDITRVVFRPEVIWPWALAELSDTSPWYGASEAMSAISAVPPTGIVSPSSGGGNETLQLLSAGLARLLVARSHGAYIYGKKPNISALARDAAAEVAYALPPDTDKTESFRKTLTEALNLLPSDIMSLDK